MAYISEWFRLFAADLETAIKAALAVAPALPTGAATEATLGDIKARLPAALVGGKLDVTLADVSAIAKDAELKLHRTLIRKVIPVVGVVDGGEVQVPGLTASAPYELRCWRSTPATTGGAATHRQRSFYEATGGAAADLAYQEAAALAIADGISVPLRPGPILVADAAGKLWIRYAITGAGDINETLTLDLLPMIAG